MIAILLAVVAVTFQLGAPADASASHPKTVENRQTGTDDAAKAATPAAENNAATVLLSGTLTLKDVCTEIEKQTGNKIVDYRDHLHQKITNPRFKLEIKDAPFWQAVDALLDATNMTVYRYSGKESLAIVDRSADELPRAGRAAYSGPLRLEVDRIVADRQPGSKRQGSLKVNLAIAWEPRMAPVMVEQPLDQIQALDDQGKPLEFAAKEAALEASVNGGGTGVQLLFPFALPPRSVAAISSLKGTLNVSLPGPLEAFTFNNLPAATQPDFKPREQRNGAVTVSLDQVRKNNDLWEVVTRVRFGNGADSPHPNHNWILQNEAYLEDSEHHRVENAGFHNSLQTNTELGIVYQFELPAGVEGYTFVYKTPTSMHVLPVTYELKNLQLP